MQGMCVAIHYSYDMVLELPWDTWQRERGWEETLDALSPSAALLREMRVFLSGVQRGMRRDSSISPTNSGSGGARWTGSCSAHMDRESCVSRSELTWCGVTTGIHGPSWVRWLTYLTARLPASTFSSTASWVPISIDVLEQLLFGLDHQIYGESRR
jgi:hypothetical protein